MESPRVHRPSAALGVVIMLVAGACGTQSSPAPSVAPSTAPAASTAATAAASEPAASASAAAGIPQGGTLSIGWNGEIQWLDPALGYDVNSWPAERLMFEPLLGYDATTTTLHAVARRRDADGLGRRQGLHLQAPQRRELRQRGRQRAAGDDR